MLNYKPLKENAFVHVLFLAAAAVFLYAPIIYHDFVWEDHLFITGTNVFRDWANAGSFFFEPFWKAATGIKYALHRPLMPFMILLVSSFSGLDPAGYHLTSLLLHTAIGIIFYGLIRWFTRLPGTALLAALIYLIHPVNSPVVCWAISMHILLSGIFLLGAFWLDSAAARDGKRDFRFWLAAGLLYPLALLAYEVTLIFPFLLLARDYSLLEYRITQKRKERIFSYVVYGAVTLAYWLYRSAVFMAHEVGIFLGSCRSSVHNVTLSGEWLEFLMPLNILERFSRLLFFPENIQPFYHFGGLDFSWSAGFSLFIFCLLTAWGLKKSADKRLLLFALLWIIAGLAPFLNIVPIGQQFATRFLYFTSLGFALWTALIVKMLADIKLPGRNIMRAGAWSLVCVLLAAWIAVTDREIKTWKNGVVFFYHAARAAPELAFLRRDLGANLQNAGEAQAAMASYWQAIALDPDYFLPYKDLWQLYSRMGMPKQARVVEKRAVSVFGPQVIKALEAASQVSLSVEA